MYKLRIGKWHMKKNFKRREHEQVALRLQPFADAGLNLPEALIEGKAVPLRRVKRHFRNELKLGPSKQRLHGKLSQTHHSAPFSDCWRQWHSPTIVRITLQQSSFAHKLERLLIQANNYYGPQLCQESNVICIDDDSHDALSNPLNHTYGMYRMYDMHCMDDMYRMDDMYHKGHVKALKVIWNCWCLLAPCLLRKFHMSAILFHYMVILCSRVLHRASNFLAQLQTHLARLIGRIVGAEHPLSMLFTLADNANGDSTSKLQVLTKLLVDAAKPFGVDSSEFQWFEGFYGEILAEEADYQTATEFYENICTREREVAGVMTRRYQALAFNLADCHYLFDNNEKAEEIILDILRHRDSTAEDDTSTTYYLALDRLGTICEERGDFKAAESWYLEAHSVCLSFYGNDTRTVMLAANAESMHLKSVATQSSCPPVEDCAVEETVVEELMYDLSRLDISEGQDVLGAENPTWHDDLSSSDTQKREKSASHLENPEDRVDDSQYEAVHDLEQSLESRGLPNGVSMNAGNREQNPDRPFSLEGSVLQPLIRDILCSDTLPEIPPHWHTDLANLSDIDFDLDLDCLKPDVGAVISEDGATDFDMDDWISYPQEESMERMDYMTDISWSWPALQGGVSPVC